jgi:hypothetical protein
LTGATQPGTHNESGISTTTYDQPAGSDAEYEFTVRNNGAPESVVYYFRAYDNFNGIGVLKNTGFNYPSIMTEAGSFTTTVESVGSGVLTENVTTNVESSPIAIDFGALVIGTDKIAAQRFSVTTNSGYGYQTFVYQKDSLRSTSDSIIEPVPGSNETPSAWPASPNPSAFGYHSGDDTLSTFGGWEARFSAYDTYASLEPTMKEILYSPIPVEDETIDIVYRINASNLQAAGDYSTEIIYVFVPTF